MTEMKIELTADEKVKKLFDNLDKRVKRIEQNLFGFEINNVKEQLNLFKDDLK